MTTPIRIRSFDMVYAPFSLSIFYSFKKEKQEEWDKVLAY